MASAPATSSGQSAASYYAVLLPPSPSLSLPLLLLYPQKQKSYPPSQHFPFRSSAHLPISVPLRRVLQGKEELLLNLTRIDQCCEELFIAVDVLIVV